MLKKSIIGLSAVAAAVASLGAIAGTYNPPPPAFDPTGFYAGIHGGWGHQGLDNQTVGGVNYDAKDKNGWAGRANVGYNHFFGAGKHWGLGGEFGGNIWEDAKWNQSTGGSFKNSVWSLDMLAVGTYRFNDMFKLFAKAGVAYVHNESKIAGSSAVTGDNTSVGWRPKVGVGGSYTIWQDNNTHEALYLDASYSYTFGNNSNPFTDRNYIPDLQFAGLGLTYKF